MSSSTSSAIASKLVAPRQALAFLYRFELFCSSQKLLNRCDHAKPSTRKDFSNETGFQAWVFSPLAEASHCYKHSPKPLQLATFFTSHRPDIFARHIRSSKYDSTRRSYADFTQSDEEETPNEANRTREELMELVDQYDGNTYTDQLPVMEPPQINQTDHGPHLTVSDKEEDEWPPPHQEWPADDDTKLKIHELAEALKDFYNEPEHIYTLYKELPSPRAPYLPSKTRHRLLHHLSVVEKKDEHSMLRYFSVIDDMKATAIPLSVSEWTSAMSFASRYVAKTTEVEVEATLRMWKEMEQFAGVKGNHATFNVLYDVACKAGKFTLAEMIFKEMRARGFEPNRFHHVSAIHACGLRGDGDGARAAYTALVDAGEIVDTVVLNAMISALIRSHEPNAAENIYERMKRMHMERSGAKLLPRNFKDARAIKRSLIKLGKISKQRPEERERLQQSSIIAPDLNTYKILVNHCAIVSGELDKATRYLDEMFQFDIPLSGALFLSLFKGFSNHGGRRYTEWTSSRLENVWKAFFSALDKSVEDLYISTWMVSAVLKAFAKCSGKSRALAVWEQIKTKWHPEDRELDVVMTDLKRIMKSEDTPPGSL
ncbi:pentatricopeptide repeat protein [Rutstroemia sp. NJR-2017a BVV2]|nr:pentatricopeptide repeat protein [Rutstroemia sp. NJR-2017a BVV2]